MATEERSPNHCHPSWISQQPQSIHVLTALLHLVRQRCQDTSSYEMLFEDGYRVFEVSFRGFIAPLHILTNVRAESGYV